MEPLTYYKIKFIMKSGRVLELQISSLELDWIIDRMFGRREGNFQNFSEMVINISEIETMEFEEVTP